MRVLVGCECSQTVVAAFRAAGHEAFSCDLEKSYGDLPEFHFIGDLREIYSFVNPELFIAHPPCTYLSNCAAHLLFSSDHKIKDMVRYEKGLLARDFFMWCYSRPARYICVENPIPMKIFGLPKYSQIIHPYYFGDPYSKATCLWLKGLSCLPIMDCNCRPVSSFTTIHKTPRTRSKLCPGIADAMVYMWGGGFIRDLQLSLF